MNTKVKKIIKKFIHIKPILFLFLLAVITFFLVEVLNDEMGFFVVFGGRLVFAALNVIIYYILYVFLYALTDSIKLSSIIGLLIFNMIGIINHFVCDFRGTAFRLADIFSVGTAGDVVTMYKFHISEKFILWLILFILTVLGVWVYLKYNRDNIKKTNMKSRISTSMIYFVLIILMIKFDYGSLGVNNFDGWDVGGYVVYFFDTMTNWGIKKPDNYERERYENIGDLEIENVNEEQLPNIIVIMNESFCDVERLFEIDTNKEIMPFFHEFVKGDNIIEGDLYVSVYAGGTANTEMEFLTGSSLGFWGTDTVCYSMGYNRKVESLPKWMNELGYETYAVHPSKSTNYGRANVYEKMQFHNKIFIDEMIKEGIETKKYKNGSYFLKEIVEDSENYKYIKDVILSEDKPLFLFNTTIQNHGGYEWRGLNDIVLNGKTDENHAEFNEYLSLIRMSDSALEELISELQNIDEKTILLFFGDHQPSITMGLAEELSVKVKSKDIHNVPFFIWANYDIETKHNVSTSTNYLQNMLLEASGIGLLNGYQRDISEIEKKYPVLSPYYSVEQSGKTVEFEQLLQKDALIQEYYRKSYKLIYDTSE